MRGETPTTSVPTGTIARLASGTAATFGGRVLGRGLQFLFQVLLARALGPLHFGIFTLALAAFRLASMLGIAGLDKTITRFASGGEGEDRFDHGTASIVRRLLLWGACSSLAVAALLFGAASPLAGLLDAPGVVSPLRVLAVAVPLMALGSLVGAVLRTRDYAMRATWIQDLLPPIVALGALPLVLDSEAQATGAAWAVAISFFVAGIFGAFELRGWRSTEVQRSEHDAIEEPRARASPVSNRKLLLYSLQALSSASFVLVLYWLDKLMVGYFLDERAVGLYQAAVQLNLPFVTIVASISAVVSPLVARSWSAGQQGSVREFFRLGVRWCLYLATPVAVMILTLPSAVLSAVFGAEYAAASTALVILGLGQFFNSATGPVGQLLMMTGGERVWFILSGGSVPLSLMLNVLLIPRFGIAGAAAGTGITLVVLFGTATLVVIRRQHIQPFGRSLFTTMIAGGLAAVVPLALRYGTELDSWPMVLAGGVAVLSIFGGTLLVLGLEVTDRQAARVLRERLARSRGSEVGS